MRPKGDLPSPELVAGLAKAYDLMKYDVAMLGRNEADFFAKAGIAPDRNRKTAEEEPFTVIHTSEGASVGFLRFPSLGEGENIPSPKLIDRITASIKTKRDNVDLLVALSDWGWVGEREYLGQNPEYVPDILLGSGLGSGVVGRLLADRRCAWYRPYDKGMTVIEAQVLAWPDRTKPFAWSEPDNLRSLSIGLGDQYPDNPEVSKILQ
ncbi:hypothetical protein GM415_13720 [Pseudodesulfovibrio cashew]|uniref:Uncharacterized protein n=2 Tax=Pseudodesulfovibrio cashew TaxID=2678688 RepID=A0A6I6JJ92_9BACT|nr:hypothetical protein [Pseudodesulfovibrio cashew]QGY41140.1 hypothetical protein GM415_13720 [Pseudodesulfovibrio cashew]